MGLPRRPLHPLLDNRRIRAVHVQLVGHGSVRPPPGRQGAEQARRVEVAVSGHDRRAEARDHSAEDAAEQAEGERLRRCRWSDQPSAVLRRFEGEVGDDVHQDAGVERGRVGEGAW